ncbi:MAG: glycosyltransferase family 1 protein [Candidatus Curtissbacteria bacterium]|nr:glycosyltransferase family 1 protein [Candidatus Curtissbacteria bacterium]
MSHPPKIALRAALPVVGKARSKIGRGQQMKIGIDISQVVYGTGVSNYTAYLVENLVKIDTKNKYVLFGSSLRDGKKLKEFTAQFEGRPNVEVKLFHFPPLLLDFLWNRLHVFPIEKLIGEVNVFHSSDWLQPPFINPNTKKVTTVHDMVAYLFPASTHPKILKTQKRRLSRVKTEVDAIIADSATTKEDLIKFLEVDEAKVHIIYLAPSADFKPQDDDKVNEVLAKYKIKKPYILSVATQEPRKNIQKLLDVFNLIGTRRDQFSLVLTGKYGWGPGFHTPEDVNWTGYVPKQDLIALYSGCRVFVYPSLYEGFGLPILEAMACGAPTVTSNNSSMAEIAKDAAILVDPRSEPQLTRAIEMVLDLNLENYQKMVRASMDRARKYTWAKTARQTLDIYENLYGSMDQKIEEPKVVEEAGQNEESRQDIEEPAQNGQLLDNES